MSKFYTGIGSRKTPKDVQMRMFVRATEMAEDGWTLRSGGADGADRAFEKGAWWSHGKMEIYLPWLGFNGSSSKFEEPTAEAMVMAEHYHPAWYKLKEGGRKLMARNCHQVLGLDLKTPSSLVLYWTEGGKEVGGTAQALRIAKDYNIPTEWIQ